LQCIRIIINDITAHILKATLNWTAITWYLITFIMQPSQYTLSICRGGWKWRTWKCRTWNWRTNLQTKRSNIKRLHYNAMCSFFK